MSALARARWIGEHARWRRLAIRPFHCPFCGPSVLVRLGDDELLVRCARCRASSIHLSLGSVLASAMPTLANADVLELSSRGPLVRHLRRRARSLVATEFFDGVASGTMIGDVRCENVEALSFPDATFDLVTHTEVFEHVADDAKGFAETCRVLRRNGAMIFTTPIDVRAPTRERARRAGETTEHALPPEYHDDPRRGSHGALCYRHYGSDILDRLRAGGFRDARFAQPPAGAFSDFERVVVVAHR